jgi:hypothetical protein
MPYTVCPNCGQRALRVATRCPRCGVAFESQFIRHAPPPARRIPVGLILAGAVLTILAGNALWQKFGVAPGATAIVRRPAPAPAPAPTIAARPEPVRQPAVTPAETPASPRPATPRAAEPRVAAPAPMVPRPAPGLAVTPPVTAPAAPVRAPASSVTVAARATASPENAAARAKRLYSSTWLNLRAERRNSSPVLGSSTPENRCGWTRSRRAGIGSCPTGTSLAGSIAACWTACPLPRSQGHASSCGQSEDLLPLSQLTDWPRSRHLGGPGGVSDPPPGPIGRGGSYIPW